MLKKIFSLLLLSVFLIETLPDDLLHQLSNHHDTVDQHSLATAISVKHIHCPALQFSLPAFSKTESLQISPRSVLMSDLSFTPTILTFSFSLLNPCGRAPPALA